ncbi:MAG TPA: response regulator transcription factor [Anaerolineaceae bacterium]|nr:response regulator transcription factor [Anaerolineaceae bacterium]HPN51986.1 response regulator transcription factor [Anaerolineaceae bacterium]
MTIRLLIADDHLIIRQGIRLILETEEEFELVGEASDGAEALRLCAELHPQVVLMDLRMPGMDGLTAIERLHVEQPDISVVILTAFNEDELMLRGLRAGAKSYLLKDTSREALFNAIRAAARSETLLSPDILSRLLNRVESTPHAPVTNNEPALLTEREREVLAAVAKGERSKEIAFRLGITERTVKAHLASIYNKLGVDSRAAAIAAAVQKGWL